MLKKGSSGIEVTQLQNALNLKTIRPQGVSALVPDGVYGPATEAMVRLYQQQNGLMVTGVADAQTLAKIGISLSVVSPYLPQASGMTKTYIMLGIGVAVAVVGATLMKRQEESSQEAEE